MHQSTITSVVLTKNEEQHIGDCLASLTWCDRRVILDSYSTDQTIEIAKKAGATIFFKVFEDYASQRNSAINLVETEWILFIDADERVSSGLEQEILKIIQCDTYDGFWIPTKNNYLGRWLVGGQFYPDCHIRLARTSKLHYDPKSKVHERAIVEGKVGFIQNSILHFASQTVKEIISSKKKYAMILAKMMHENNKKPTYQVIFAPFATFIEIFIIKKGFKDGFVGLILSSIWAYFEWFKYFQALKLSLFKE